MSDDDYGSGSNCSDETKRDAYHKAALLKIAEESAHETYKSKQGAFRSYLKAAGKLGVDTDAIVEQLKIRFNDPDLELIKLRERIKMMELSGFLPGIMDQLMDRYDVQEATHAEEEESQVLIAYDRGHLAGRKGHIRDNNPYPPGSLGHVKWIDGWNGGQKAIAEEMAYGEDGRPVPPPEKPKRGRPPGSGKKANAPPAGGAAEMFKPDTAESVADAVAQDEELPSVLH